MGELQRILIVPGAGKVTEVSSAGVIEIPLRKALHLDRLADALARQLGVPAVVDEALPLAPGAGTLMFGRPDVLDRLTEAGTQAFSWVVAIDLDRTRILKRSEALGLAAAVEVQDYLAWMQAASEPAAIFGRKELADRIGARLATNPLQSSARYARMTLAADLPTLLARYLATYFQTRLASP